MSALPLRSIQPRTPARLSTIKRTRKAFVAMMARSTIMMLRCHPSRFDTLIADGVEIQTPVGVYFLRQRPKNLRWIEMAVSFAAELQQPNEDFTVLERALGRNERGVEFLYAPLAIGVSAFLFTEVGRWQDHVRQSARLRHTGVLDH